MAKARQDLLARPQRKRDQAVPRAVRGGTALVVGDLIVHRHDAFGFAGWFGFYAAYGFFACVALVLTAKAMRRVLKRPEDYYDR